MSTIDQLCDACQTGNLIEMINKAYKCGNINQLGEGEMTPLSLAVLGSHVEIVKSLLLMGANPNKPSRGGYCPLHYASNVEIVEVLIKAKANPNWKSDDGNTALHHLAFSSFICHDHICVHYEIARLLINAGAKVDCVNGKGKTPLQEAKICDHRRIVRLLETK